MHYGRGRYELVDLSLDSLDKSRSQPLAEKTGSVWFPEIEEN
jgi:hypothetical protein